MRYIVEYVALFILTLAMACAGSVLPGCAAIRGACAAALPTITAAQSYSADARDAIARVKAIGFVGAEGAIADCEQALVAVDATLVAASNACTTTDPLSVFAGFVSAWTKLEPLLTQLNLAGLARTSGSYHTPLIVLRARGL